MLANYDKYHAGIKLTFASFNVKYLLHMMYFLDIFVTKCRNRATDRGSIEDNLKLIFLISQ